MGKTALFYHSGGSSGYESMLRDSSENTGSTSSAQDSLSEHSSVTTSSRRSSKSSKKNRNNAGHSQTFNLDLTFFIDFGITKYHPHASPVRQQNQIISIQGQTASPIQEAVYSFQHPPFSRI